GDSDVHALDHYVAFLFGINDCFVHAFHRRFKIDNLTLAHAARRRLAYSKNFDGPIRSALADDDADLGSADLKTDHQIIVRHYCYSLLFCRLRIALGTGVEAPRDFGAEDPPCCAPESW